MVNVIEKAVEALKDLKNPNGELDANTIRNAIINNLQAGEANLSALDISGKKDDMSMFLEIMPALSQRFTRQKDEILADLKNPEGKINAKAAERMINDNELEIAKIRTTLGTKENKDAEKEAAELKELLSKRYVRQGLEVWDDLKKPEGSLDANVARLLIQTNLRDAGVTFAALDNSGKKSEEEMTAVFNAALSKRYVKQGLEAWVDLQNPEGKMDAYSARDIIKNNFRDGRVTLAALDTSGKKTEQEMTAEFNKAFAERATRVKNQWEFNPDAIIKYVENLGKKGDSTAHDDGEVRRQFTPTFPNETASGMKK